MLSKSLIQFYVEGWGCVHSLLFELRPNYGGSNGGNAASFKRSHVPTSILSAPNPAAGLHQPTPSPETPGHSEDLLELTHKKDVLSIIGDWNAKVGSQEIPGVTGKFGLGVWNEARQRLIEFCQENALVIAKTFFQQ